MKKKPTSIPLVIFRMNFFKLWPCTFYVTSAPISSRMVSTIMADECTDVSNKEQFVVCIRWVDNTTLIHHEDCVGLYGVDTIDSNTLMQSIEDVLYCVWVYYCHSVVVNAMMVLPTWQGVKMVLQPKYKLRRRKLF